MLQTDKIEKEFNKVINALEEYFDTQNNRSYTLNVGELFLNRKMSKDAQNSKINYLDEENEFGSWKKTMLIASHRVITLYCPALDEEDLETFPETFYNKLSLYPIIINTKGKALYYPYK